MPRDVNAAARLTIIFLSDIRGRIRSSERPRMLLMLRPFLSFINKRPFLFYLAFFSFGTDSKSGATVYVETVTFLGLRVYLKLSRWTRTDENVLGSRSGWSFARGRRVLDMFLQKVLVRGLE